MSEKTTDTSWWQTLPGVLTGIAAVITAVGTILAVLYQSGFIHREVPTAASAPPQSTSPHEQSQAPANINPGVPESPKENSQASESAQVRAGHYAFKLLDTKLESYSGKGSKTEKFALRLSLRVTDVMGVSDYVDRRTIRLSVDGAELLPENSINFAVSGRESVETEALFIVPADASAIALLLGRPEDAVAKLPLSLNLSVRP
jgi:hypothetical protein